MPGANRHWIALALAALITLAFAAKSTAISFSVQQITDNTSSDNSPDVDGQYVVWQGFVSGSSTEVFQYDGSETRRITNNGYSDLGPSASGERIVWGSGAEDLFGTGGLSAYDGTSASEIVAPGTGIFSYDNAGETIVYSGRGDSGNEDVFRYDGVSHVQITDDPSGQTGVQIFGSRLLWMNQFPGTTGSWWALPLGYGIQRDPVERGVGSEIVLYDAGSVSVLTAPGERAFSLDSDGDTVAWSSWDGTDLEIYVYRDGEVTAITDNDREDRSVGLSDLGVAWTAWDGNDYEIFFYDYASGGTTQLTSNSGNDFLGGVSGTSITWEGFDGQDWEIYLATVPEPSTALLVALGLGGLSGWRRRARALPER